MMRDWQTPIGESIVEALSNLGLSTSILMERLDWTEERLDLLLSGELPLSDDVAVVLEQITDIPSRYWIQKEILYRASIGVDY